MAQEGSSGSSGSQGSAANVTHALKGIDFPASKQDIIKHAQNNNADQVVLDELKNLPDEQYNNMADVMKGFGQSK
ncbi:MAG: DUF2795 domain-containing protein [Rhodospirillaceae bacterium]|nr:DUF2795 domain-containing protein [Rhodospirillales bacterium]